MSLRRLLLSHLRPYQAALVLVVVLQLVQTTATMLLPALGASLIDDGVLVGDRGHVWWIGGVMLACAAVQIVVAAGAVYHGARVATAFGRDVRRDLFHQVTGYSGREVSRFGAPSLITRITNDVQQVQLVVVLVTTIMVTAPMMLVLGLVMAVREDVGLSVVPAVAIPVAVVILGLVISRMVPAFRLMQERIDRLNGVLREQISGMRVVRAFVREPQERERFAVANAEVTEVALRAGRLMAMLFPTIGTIVNLASTAVIWVGAERVADGSMQVGSLVAYLTYIMQILMAVVMSTFVVSMLPRATVAADRIIEVLETDTSVAVPEDPVTELPERATLEFRDVGFRYSGAQHAVLSGVSFRVGPGETAAVIGSTGAGKSTLVNLVPRLFDATSGSVLVDGVDVRLVDPAALSGRVGYVPQRAYLFSGTVASNLRFGRPAAGDDELWGALEIAQAEGFVRAMPDGLDSVVDQGGTNLSGGQRQRLAIARALVVRPEIYVFDDSFSALDLATDARLRAALAPHTADAAVLIVAQRVSTIRNADRIVVLEDGLVVGVGTHDELVATCPTYAEIVESQHAQGMVA